jgi:hypothetical protein
MIRMSVKTMGPFDLDRVFRAVDKLQDRLRRATKALEAEGVPYAVAGGNAVANWVSRVDEAAVRFTQDIDILIRRDDLPAARAALEADGFRCRQAAEVHMFLDGAEGRFRDAVHVLFAGEKVREEFAAAAPQVDESEAGREYRVLSLEALVRMELTSYRRENRMHLRDLLDVGLIDAEWIPRVPVELAARLQELLDTPEG